MTGEKDTEALSSVIVRAASMHRVYEFARRVASCPLPVLITGETGSGKELIAQTLHREGAHRAGPFVPLNCGALPPTLIESVLFGYVRGAFTGAERATPGAFQQADGGTLFLDEIGELHHAAQAALLRVLETGMVRPLGAQQEVRVHVRIVAATHRDIDANALQGGFRQDLLHRINALTVHLPPLRERREEIEPLAVSFLAQAQARVGEPLSFDSRALQCLIEYDWPGNVRELRNAVESAAALCEGDAITLDDLPARVRMQRTRVPARDANTAADGEGAEDAFAPNSPALVVEHAHGSLRARLRAYEIKLLLDGLRRAGGNQCRAAELLDIPRRTLCRRIKELGLASIRPHRAAANVG